MIIARNKGGEDWSYKACKDIIPHEPRCPHNSYFNATLNYCKCNDVDKYIGYIKKNNFPPNHKNTHKISVLYSNLYQRPNIKYKIKNRLSFGSKIKVSKKKGLFYKFDSYWLKKNDVKGINTKTKICLGILSNF